MSEQETVGEPLSEEEEFRLIHHLREAKRTMDTLAVHRLQEFFCDRRGRVPFPPQEQGVLIRSQRRGEGSSRRSRS